MKLLQYKSLNYFQAPLGKDIYYYFSQSPSPQKDANGNAMLSLMGATCIWFLQISTTWEADLLELEELKEKLREEKELTADSKFLPAPMESVKARLYRMGEASVSIANSSTSGHYPYSALFNLTLSDKDQEDIAPAFKGVSEILGVTYEGSLSWLYDISAKIKGTLRLSKIGKPNSLSFETIQSFLEQEIAENVLVIEMNAAEVDDQILERLRQQLIDEAVTKTQMLLKKDKLDDVELEIAITNDIPHPIPISVTADLGVWVKNSKIKHLKQMNQ